MSKIAILAYGSLIWSPRNLKTRGDWQYGGPKLPVEFSRIARDGRLVLTYTPGADPQPTFYAPSTYDKLEEAIANVAEREGCHIRHISASDSNKPLFQQWLQEHGFDHALYCALPVNFEELRGEAPGGVAAQQYLDTLDEGQLKRAWEYIVNAPTEITTPIRRFLLEKYREEQTGSGRDESK